MFSALITKTLLTKGPRHKPLKLVKTDNKLEIYLYCYIVKTKISR